MGDGVRVFVAGLLGVFLGMALLYLSIKITGKAVFVLESRQKANADAEDGVDK